MGRSWAELQALSDDEIVALCDTEAEHVGAYSLNHWRNEMFCRRQEQQSGGMLRLMRWITIMTGVMTAATIVNVVLFALS